LKGRFDVKKALRSAGRVVGLSIHLYRELAVSAFTLIPRR
jgi:hypothetical protein